jgi:hypothetical protein
VNMRFSLIAILAALAVSVVGATNNPAAVAAPINGPAIQAGVTDGVVSVRMVYRCKINGRWHPGRCPGSNVTCVNRHGGYRHAGHC